MLNLTTQALNPQQLKERLEVKYKELEVIRNNLSAVATHAALVAGFAFQGMRAEKFGDNCPVSLRGSFYVTAVSVMGLELYTVFMSTLCVVCGPNLAMRGTDPQTAVDLAVQGMFVASRTIFPCFISGIFFFQIAAMQWVVAKLLFSENATNNVKNELWASCGILVIVFFLSVTFGHGYKLYHRYFVTDTSNTFQVDKDWFLFNNNNNNNSHHHGGGPTHSGGYHSLDGGGGGGGGGGRGRGGVNRMFNKMRLYGGGDAGHGAEGHDERALMDRGHPAAGASEHHGSEKMMVHMGQYGGGSSGQGAGDAHAAPGKADAHAAPGKADAAFTCQNCGIGVSSSFRCGDDDPHTTPAPSARMPWHSKLTRDCRPFARPASSGFARAVSTTSGRCSEALATARIQPVGLSDNVAFFLLSLLLPKLHHQYIGLQLHITALLSIAYIHTRLVGRPGAPFSCLLHGPSQTVTDRLCCCCLSLEREKKKSHSREDERGDVRRSASPHPPGGR